MDGNAQHDARSVNNWRQQAAARSKGVAITRRVHRSCDREEAMLGPPSIGVAGPVLEGFGFSTPTTGIWEA